MLDKNKIHREIARLKTENNNLQKEIFPFSDGFNTGQIKILEMILKGGFDLK